MQITHYVPWKTLIDITNGLLIRVEELEAHVGPPSPKEAHLLSSLVLLGSGYRWQCTCGVERSRADSHGAWVDFHRHQSNP
jgi:hypothetical protein